jgi:hypothetical protein
MLIRIGMTAIALTAMVASPAGAACFGSSTFSTCNDDSGNHYTVQRFGNQTTVQGSNPYTGSTWSERSTTFGNMNMTNGVTNGMPWHENQIDYGNGNRSITGTNSLGQPFSYHCTPYGGCN